MSNDLRVYVSEKFQQHVPLLELRNVGTRMTSE
jgi:hypothetical protein